MVRERSSVGPRIAFRVDGSVAIGTGHVMRCLSLAATCRKDWSLLLFIVRCITLDLRVRLEAQGIEALILPKGLSECADANQTAALCRKYAIDWLILDGYQFDPTYESRVRHGASKILSIRDGPIEAPSDADVVLNQNLGRNVQFYHRPVSPRLLSGPQFALMRPEFAPWHCRSRRIPERADHLLITLGGSDSNNHTLKILKTVADFPGDIRVLVGGSNPHLSDLQRAMKQRSNVEIVHNATHVAALMAWADLMIAAAGSTCWEICCLGVPSILLSIADNQRSVGESMQEFGAARYLGDVQCLNPSDLRQALDGMAKCSATRFRLSEAGKHLVDGRGCRRVGSLFIQQWSISILHEDVGWLTPHVVKLQRWLIGRGHRVQVITDPRQAATGDLAFILSAHGQRSTNPLLRNHASTVQVQAGPLGLEQLTWLRHPTPQDLVVTLSPAQDHPLPEGSYYLKQCFGSAGQKTASASLRELGGAIVDLCRKFVSLYPDILSAAGVAQAKGATGFLR